MHSSEDTDTEIWTEYKSSSLLEGCKFKCSQINEMHVVYADIYKIDDYKKQQ